MTAQLETCANCCASIGRLEHTFIWEGQIVCAPCYRRLAGGMVAQAPPAFVAAPQPAAETFMHGAVTLTPTQLQMGSTVYPLRNIASVSSSGNIIRGHWRGWPGIVVIAAGLLTLFVALMVSSGRDSQLKELEAYRNGEQYRQIEASGRWTDGALVAGIAIIGSGAIFTLMFRKRTPDRALYTIAVTANSGDSHFVQTGHAHEAHRLMSELRDAMSRVGSSATFNAMRVTINRR
jgi:hypothetical protein